MNYLDAVVFGEPGLRPVDAAHHFTIQFDGETPGREAQVSDQVADTNIVGHVACFAVDRNAQSRVTPFFQAG